MDFQQAPSGAAAGSTEHIGASRIPVALSDVPSDDRNALLAHCPIH